MEKIAQLLPMLYFQKVVSVYLTISHLILEGLILVISKPEGVLTISASFLDKRFALSKAAIVLV